MSPPLVCFEILILVFPCLASRDSSAPLTQPADLAGRVGLSALEEGAMPSILVATRSHQGVSDAEDPPKPDALKEHIAQGGPLEKGMETAVEKADALEKAAKDWSETSRAIEGLSQEVASQADESNVVLKKADGLVHNDAEAGVQGILADAGKAAAQRNSSDNTSLLQGLLNSSESQPPDNANSSVLQVVRDPDGTEHIAEAGMAGISNLMSDLTNNYDRLEVLLKDAASTAKEAKETARHWASGPPKDFQEKSSDAYKVVTGVSEALRTGHEKIEREVAHNVDSLLGSINPGSNLSDVEEHLH